MSAPSYAALLEKVQALEANAKKQAKIERSLRQAENFAKTVLNSLSAHIAILDADGVILETNQAWKAFALENAITVRPDMIGVNYLKLCDNATGPSAEGAHEVAHGIRQVIAGNAREFVVDYPCHAPSAKRWFYMRATRMTGSEPLRIVVSHENITALKQAEAALQGREAELTHKTRRLDEANTALKVLLKQREADRCELEESLVANVRELVFPYLEKLDPADPAQAEYVRIIRAYLNEITAPFLHRLSAQYRQLTPQEIRVAGLVRLGKSSKEIAAALNISLSAVEFHRKNLRLKFGLKGKKANLRAYLLSFAENR